jgi:hypothetical protein
MENPKWKIENGKFGQSNRPRSEPGFRFPLLPIFYFLVSIVLAAPAQGQGSAYPTSPTTVAPAVSWPASGLTLTYTVGTIYQGGTAYSITGGTLTMSTNQTSCAAPAFSACNFVYWPGSGTALLTTTSYSTAVVSSNVILYYVTTSSAGNITGATYASVSLLPLTVALKPSAAVDGVRFVSTVGLDTNSGTSRGDAMLTPQAAATALHNSTAGGGTVLVAPGQYPCPTIWYSGVAFVAPGGPWPPVLWSQFQGDAQNYGWAGSGGLNQVQFNCTANLTIHDVSQIHIENIVFDFGGSYNMTLMGVSGSEFPAMAVVNTGLSAPALTLDGSHTIFHTMSGNRFGTLIVEGGSEGLAMGNNTWLGGGNCTYAPFTNNRIEFVWVLAYRQPSGSYNAVDFVGCDDSNIIGYIFFGHTSAMTSIGSGVIFNSASTTADMDADNEWIGQFGFNGPTVTCTSLTFNPSVGNYIGLNMINGCSNLVTNTSWSGHTDYQITVLSSSGPGSGGTGFWETQTLVLNRATPALKFAQDGTTKWGIYIDSSGNMDVHDYVNTKDPFYISAGAPTGSFSMASNGVIGIASGLTASGTAGLSGTGACASLSNQSPGTWSGHVKCTGTTGASTLVITPGFTATTDWNCTGADTTNLAAGIQFGLSATTCTLSFSSVTANDVVTFNLWAH